MMTDTHAAREWYNVVGKMYCTVRSYTRIVQFGAPALLSKSIYRDFTPDVVCVGSADALTHSTGSNHGDWIYPTRSRAAVPWQPLIFVPYRRPSPGRRQPFSW